MLGENVSSSDEEDNIQKVEENIEENGDDEDDGQNGEVLVEEEAEEAVVEEQNDENGEGGRYNNIEEAEMVNNGEQAEDAIVEAAAIDDQEAAAEPNPFLRPNVYYAAKDGLAIALYALVADAVNIEARNAIINQEFYEPDGQSFTPLVIAARNGRFKTVSMLMNFMPDLERECTVKFDGHIVQGATALWCASGSGHLNVVKLLVQSGANVNHQTKTKSTPLRAACFDGRLDIVKYLVTHNADINLANAFNNTCLMISSYKGHTEVVEYLLANGADIDVQAHCGATALHYAAECGHVDICSMLLDYGATMKKNEYGMTPALTAAERTKELVVEMFYSRPGLLTKLEKITALELMGASFANDKDNYNLNKAFHYLMLGMELRYDDPDNVVKKEYHEPIAAYEKWIETRTIQDLRAIKYNSNSLHMESLTIRERILTPKCPDVAHPVVFRGAVCADNGRFDRCESLWLHALSLRQANNLSVQRDLLRFAQVFSQMIHVGTRLRLQNILAVLSACILELERNKIKILEPATKDDSDIGLECELNIITALYLCTILTKILTRDNVTPSDNVKSSIYKLVFALNKMNLRHRDGQGLLHLAVNGITPVDDFHTSDVCRFPCVETVRLLIHCGADVTLVDCDRNSPLHTLTSTLQSARAGGVNQQEVVEKITQIFIDAGVHLDAVNSAGLTAAQMCTLQPTTKLMQQFETKQTCLKCIAARAIAQHQIAYKGAVPRHLELFVQLHAADKL